MEEDSPQLSGLPASADRATRLGEVPHFTCKRDQKNKERLYGEIGNPTEAGSHLPVVPYLNVYSPFSNNNFTVGKTIFVKEKTKRVKMV